MIQKNQKEWQIIGEFYKYVHQHEDDVFLFTISNGDEIVVKYETDADSDNDLDMDDKNYEEFTEFYFTILKVVKNCSGQKLRKNKGIALNYHNFPVKWEVIKKEDISKFKIHC